MLLEARKEGKSLPKAAIEVRFRCFYAALLSIGVQGIYQIGGCVRPVLIIHSSIGMIQPLYLYTIV